MAGCTQTALEIAVLLTKAKQSVAVFLEDETYENYINYHGIESAPNGCQVNDLTFFPLSIYKDKRMYIRFSVLDVGYAPIIQDDEAYMYFETAEIKICICSFNEWDISKLADYLNSTLPYIKEINYVFFPVSEETYVQFQKQMDKGHCKSFRIRNSPHYTKPCDWNAGIYNQILTTYIDLDIGSRKQKKRFLFGLF